MMTLLMDAAAVAALAKMGAAVAASIAVIGAALGIGKIGSQALDSLARQPEVAGNISSNMIISAALIEGIAFFAVIAAVLVIFLV